MKNTLVSSLALLLYQASTLALIGPFFHPRGKNFDISFVTRDTREDRQYTITSDDQTYDFTFQAPLTKKTVIRKALDLPLKKGFHYTINQSDMKRITAKMPPQPKKDDPFTFLVYGDLREPNTQPLAPKKKYETQNSVAQATIHYISDYLEKHSSINPALHLLSGDITRDGGNGEQLESILASAQKLLGNQIIMSSIGNHELFNYYTSSKKKKYFLTPHFGNLFYYDEPYTEPKWFKTANKLTQRSFDIGCIRFIHLPYIDFETVHGHPELINNFIKTVQQAHRDKAHKKIQFIIVYTHNPLVTHPQYKTKHYGIFEGHNPKREDKATIIGEVKKLEACFETYAIDAVFCGHNHIYSRLNWGTQKFTMPQITMGLGTHLHEALALPEQPSKKKHHGYTVDGKAFYDKNSFSHDGQNLNILGFLTCTVNPQDATLSITLHASPHYTDGRTLDYQKLDAVMIKPRVAHKDAEMPPICHAPFDGLGPFIHPKLPSSKADITIIIPTDEQAGALSCNGVKPGLITPINSSRQLVKFIDIDLSSSNYFITKERKLYTMGYVPYPRKNDTFSLYVYGDTRGTSTDGTSIYERTLDYMKAYESQFHTKAAAILNTGDLVKHGGRSDQWIDFFALGNDLYRGRIFMAALGNHELYVRPNEYYTQMVPHFAHIFFLDSPFGPSFPRSYLNQTVTSSDVGPIRFIHLPYIEPGFINGMSPDPIDLFLEQIKQADRDIRSENSPIKYIVWYIHRPFVGTQTKYRPLFTDTREGYPQLAAKLYTALDDYPPSGIFFGHKHYYFRADYINKHQVNIPMVTVGFSTSINPAGKAKRYKVGEHLVKPRKTIAKQQYPHNLLGFIDCTVGLDRISGKLMGQSAQNPDEQATFNLLDSFTFYQPVLSPKKKKADS